MTLREIHTRKINRQHLIEVLRCVQLLPKLKLNELFTLDDDERGTIERILGN